jgi:hypothetical protein
MHHNNSGGQVRQLEPKPNVSGPLHRGTFMEGNQADNVLILFQVSKMKKAAKMMVD